MRLALSSTILALGLATVGCGDKAQVDNTLPDRAPPRAGKPVNPVTAPIAGQPSDQAVAESIDARTRKIAAAACRKDEMPIFACTIANGKPLSVCATKQGKGVYRYGSDTAELELGNGAFAVDQFARGGEAQIRFINGDTSYTVFSRMVATSVEEGGTGPSISDGVVIEQRGKLLAVRVCEGRQADLPIQYGPADLVFKDRQDIFTGWSAEADEIE